MIILYLFAAFGFFTAFMIGRALIIANQWWNDNLRMPDDDEKDELIRKILFRNGKEQ
jgi:hypothetical protein